MDLGLEYVTVFQQFGRGAELSQFFQARTAGLFTVEREICGVLQTQHVEDVLLGVIAQALTGNLLQDVLQGDEVEAAVELLGAGTEVALDAGRDVHHEGIRCVFPEFGDVSGNVGQIRGQSGRMGEEVLDGDVHLLVGLGVFPRLEIREIIVHRVYQADLALLYQLHEGKGGSHALGHRGHVKHGFEGHGVLFGYQGFVSEGFFIHQVAIAHHAHHGTGDFSGGDGGIDGTVNEGKARCAHPLGHGGGAADAAVFDLRTAGDQPKGGRRQ